MTQEVTSFAAEEETSIPSTQGVLKLNADQYAMIMDPEELDKFEEGQSIKLTLAKSSERMARMFLQYQSTEEQVKFSMDRMRIFSPEVNGLLTKFEENSDDLDTISEKKIWFWLCELAIRVTKSGYDVDEFVTHKMDDLTSSFCVSTKEWDLSQLPSIVSEIRHKDGLLKDLTKCYLLLNYIEDELKAMCDRKDN